MGWWADLTGKTAGKAAIAASNIQADAGKAALEAQRAQYEQGRSDMMPWAQAGRQGLNTLTSMLHDGSLDQQAFSNPEFQHENFSYDYKEDPGYQFVRDEGMRGLQRSAAAKGGLGTGNTLAGLINQNQNLANNYYNQGYGRALSTYNTNRNNAQGVFNTNYGINRDIYNSQGNILNNRYNRFNTLAGMGLNATGNMNNMGQAYGQSQANGINNIGNVQGAGVMGNANARAGGARFLTQSALDLANQGAKVFYGGGR